MSFQQMGDLRIALFIEFLLYTRSFTYVTISYLILTIALKVGVNTLALPIKKMDLEKVSDSLRVSQQMSGAARI